MQNYFYIQPITINISPFETTEVNAIKWSVLNLKRNAETAVCSCGFLNLTLDTTNSYYNWKISIPKSVLDQWLDDSVIDDYICTTDPRFVKDTTMVNRPLL